MHLVQILLPVADNSGRSFSQEEFDLVKQELAQRFKGVTAFLQAPAEGLWRHEDGSDRDRIVIFEVMVEDVDIADWRRRRTDLERQFRQDRIVIRYLPMSLI
jgi:hypothetical protein